MTITNLLTTILSNLIVLVASAYFSRMIMPSDYGLLAIASTLASVFSTVLSLQVATSIGPSINEFGEGNKKSYRLSIAVFSTLIYLFASLLIILCSSIVINLTGISFDLLIFALAYGYGIYMVNIYVNSNNFDFKPTSNFIIKLILSLVSFLMSVFFVYIFRFKQNLLAREIGLGGTYFIIATFVLFSLFISNKFRISSDFRKHIRFCLIFTLPLIFNYIVDDILSLTDKLMIKYIVDMEQVGIYSLAVSFSTVCIVFAAMFENSFTPFYYKYIDNNDFDGLKLHTDYWIELFTVITCGFILLSKEVFYIYADVKYHYGAIIIPIIALMFFFHFLNLTPLNFHFYNKVSKFSTISSIISFIFNIVLNYFLIRTWGIIGAAVASCLSRFLIFVLNHLLAKFVINNNYIFDGMFFFKWIIVALIVSIMFYLLFDIAVARWIIGATIGVIEIYRIYKRKTVF